MADINNLNAVWEWNFITGDPYIPPDASPNSRYCPTVEEIGELLDSRLGVSDDLKQGFFDFMTSNLPILHLEFEAHSPTELLGYLRLLRKLNLKKLRLDYFIGGGLRINKLPRDTPFTGEPDGIVNEIRMGDNKSVHRLVADINHNSMLGWLGPGTFPCHHTGCKLCTHVGRTATVNLGRHGQLQLTKRGYCFTRNSNYVGTCQQCEEEDTFAVYYGESSDTLNVRFTGHHGRPCKSSSILKNKSRFPTVDHQRNEVERVIAAGTDPDEILRDWFAHVTPQGIHPGYERISVVDIIPHSFLRNLRERNLVAEHMFWNGDFDYLGNGRGCLNTYANK